MIKVEYSGKRRLVYSDKAVITEASCDRCGADLIIELASQSDLEKVLEEKAAETGAVIDHARGRPLIESASFEYSAGYGSPWDGDHWKADLCPQCALAMKDFINQGDGYGVQTERDEWSPAGDEDWAIWAPFEQTAIEGYTGEHTCIYHPQETLVLTEAGLACPLKYCDLLYEYVSKDDLPSENPQG